MTDDSKATTQVGQGPKQTAEMRGDHWRSIARRHADDGNGYRLYGGDWAALASTLDGLLAERDRLRRALEEARDMLAQHGLTSARIREALGGD